MLENPNPGDHLSEVLSRRRPALICFALLTPGIFQRHSWSRRYGRVIREYQQQSETLGRDLAHRIGEDWDAVSKRLDWLTKEDRN